MKDINDMTEEEIQEEINKIRNMTDEDVEREVLKIKEEYDHFRISTVPQILQIFEEEQYRVDTCCQGLIVILKALIKNFGTKEMLDACVKDLTDDMENLKSIPIKE